MASPFLPTAQVPGVYHRRLGALTVTALHAGYFDGSTDLVTGISLEEANALQRAGFRHQPTRVTVNAFVVSGADFTVLIDGGAVPAMIPGMAQVPANMAAAGIDPASITAVLLTHMHPDHIGALTLADGSAAFPNAELLLHEKEAEFWLDPAALARAPEAAKPYFQAAQAAAAPYAKRLRPVSGGAVLPHIEAVPEPGHTPGHTGWHISSDDEQLLIWGDIVHLPAIQFARPEAGMVYDVDGAQAQATRRRIFDRAAADRLLIAGMHLDFPCFGHLARNGEAYAYVPEPFTTAL